MLDLPHRSDPTTPVMPSAELGRSVGEASCQTLEDRATNLHHVRLIYAR